jgi:galactose-1-phosphate uridylyltransferase
MINKTQIEQGLIEEMGLGDLPAEKQQELTNKMLEVLLKRIYVEASQKLSKEDGDSFAQMIDQGSKPEEMEKFLMEKVPDFENMLQEILVDFKKEMLKM